jgi:hypothetical protein
MTGQPYDDDDAEFDAFLQGKGPLAQGLAELTQPEPSATLDAAILAQVAADLARGPASGHAANDNAAPHDFQPYRWRERWRMPLALAAGVTAISIALPLWQEEVAQQQQATNAPLQEMRIPAVPATPAAPDAAVDAAAAPAAKAEAAHRDGAAGQRKDDREAAARQAAQRERARTSMMQQRAQQTAPAMDAAPIPERMHDAVPAPALSRTPATVATGLPQQPPLLKTPPLYAEPAPTAPKAMPSHHFTEDTDSQVPYAPALVARIEQLLKEGRRDEALAEWERLRAAYPDYPVPDKLREALGR